MDKLLTGVLWTWNVAAAAFLAYAYYEPSTVDDPLLTTVRVDITGGGHGSGTHIGDGYIITAGHVAERAGESHKVVFENGDTHEVETMWSSPPTLYDVALLRITDYDSKIPASNLECRVPERGEEIRIFGNPLSYDFTVTYGHVSGGIGPQGKYWQESIPVDAAAGPGNSGGGMFDNDGDLVGILVGSQYHNAGSSFAPDVIAIGINIVVPSQTICNLMGRS